MTLDEIMIIADSMFPIQKNGIASYREYQRETIMQALDAFLFKGKKFVLIDGPVGCGKSAINFTIAKTIHFYIKNYLRKESEDFIPCNTVYLTHQKDLQRQIDLEDWPGIRMIQGKGSYLCNKYPYDNTSCSYSGDDKQTCNNDEKSTPPTLDLENFIDTIESRISNIKTATNDYQKLLASRRTSFKDSDNIMDVLMKCCENESMGVFSEGYVRLAFGCPFSEIECPVRSARTIARNSPVALLNPDVFYRLNMYNPTFSNNLLMIIDECHTIEDFIKRIFSTSIPVTVMRDIFGMDITKILTCKNEKEFSEMMTYYLKSDIGAIVSAARTMKTMADTVKVIKIDDISTVRTRNEFYNAMMLCVDGFRKYGHINMLDIIDDAIANEEMSKQFELIKPFWEAIHIKFDEVREKVGCTSRISVKQNMYPAFARYAERTGIVKSTFHMKEHFAYLSEIVDEFIDEIKFLISFKNGEYETFVHENKKENIVKNMTGSAFESLVEQYYENNVNGDFISITPIAVGALMSQYFYKTSKFVLLSTGTWVEYKKMAKVFGIPENQFEYIRIKPTFDVKQRKVWVMHNEEMVNFSEKIDNDYGTKMYLYKTPEGSQLFNNQLNVVINTIRQRISDQYNENPNILVHCFSFDIAARIAEYYPEVGSNVLIQLPASRGEIVNRNTGIKITGTPKDDIIAMLKGNPNSGIIAVSPSIMEGLDCKYQIARAQIILKHPIPNIGDPYVQAYYKGNKEVGVERDYGYLDRCAYIDMMQMYGRIMRAKDDWGFTVVFDQASALSLKRMLSDRSGKMISNLGIQYFMSAIQGGMNNGEVYFNPL